MLRSSGVFLDMRGLIGIGLITNNVKRCLVEGFQVGDKLGLACMSGSQGCCNGNVCFG